MPQQRLLSLAMLELKNLRAEGGVPITLVLEAGQCLGLSGRSGSGKSRLLRAIADLDPHQGTASLDGRAQTEMSGPEWRRQVVYVPTESGWWADFVNEHMGSGAAEYLPKLGLPADAVEWPVSRLSTGEKQRLALIRALCLNPPVLLLDEVLAELDRARRSYFLELLNGVEQTILATTDAEMFPASFRDRVTTYQVAEGIITPA